MKPFPRNFQASTAVRILVVSVVPVEPDLTVVRAPIAVRDLAVWKALLLVLYSSLVTRNRFKT